MINFMWVILKYSTPRHPQKNGVIEIVHKGIRRFLILKFGEFDKNFDLKNELLEAVNCHNHNIHSTTGFRPSDLINNTNEEIKKKVLDNIKKRFNIDHKEYDNIAEGCHILINQNVHKKGKKLMVSKFKNKEKIFKIPATVLSNYGGGLLAISIDISNYELEKGEECIIDSKLCSLISQDLWNTIIKENEDKNIVKKTKTNKYPKRLYSKDS